MKLGADDARVFFENRKKPPLGLTKIIVTDIRLSVTGVELNELAATSMSDNEKIRWSVIFQAAVGITKKEEATQQVSPPKECEAFVDGLCDARNITFSDRDMKSIYLTVQAIRGSEVIKDLMNQWDADGQPSFTDQDIQRASQTLERQVSDFEGSMRRSNSSQSKTGEEQVSREKRSIEDCTLHFLTDGAEVLEESWPQISETLDKVGIANDLSKYSKETLVSEMLPALLVVESQAIINLFDFDAYKRFKQHLFMTIRKMFDKEPAERFVELFEYYERMWKRAMSEAEAGNPGKRPYGNGMAWRCLGYGARQLRADFS